MFCRLKDFRRTATRYDKLARSYLASLCLAALIPCWPRCVSTLEASAHRAAAYMRNMEIVSRTSDSVRLALLEHSRVIHAIMLRDIKTRMGGSYFGFALSLMIPLVHIGALLAIYVLIGRRAPIGTDVTVYLATAMLPFVVWSYTYQKIIHCFPQNMPLMALPIVSLIDIFVARSIVELLESAIIIVVVASFISAAGHELFVRDPVAMLYTFLMAYALGVATGLIMGIFGMLAPFMRIIGFVFIPIYWITAGAVAIPDALPEQLRLALFFFPLSHVVDFGRTAFYSSYISSYANLTYVHALIIGNLTLGLVLERYLQPLLTQK